MISFLRGVLIESLADAAVIDVGGVGFLIHLHARAVEALPPKGREVLLYTKMMFSDNELRLYGFLSHEELELFNLLNSISGLGPRSALAIMGRFSPGQFFQVVASQDMNRLTTVPGVGKKSAERILFELKDKVRGLAALNHVEAVEVEELMEALEALGYTRSEVYKDVINVVNRFRDSSLEDKIRMVLKERAR